MKVMYSMIGAVATLLVACSGGKSVRYDKGMLEQSSVIGHVEKVNGQDLIVCELDLLKDSLQVPLSYLTEELQIVKLAGEDAALVGKGAVYVSDNYILIKGSANMPCKLFYKDGKFVGNVGAIGQGPGEYTMVYDIQIDEAGQRIYLLSWDADQILAYNLEGNYVRSIPLNKKYEKLRVPKGVFKSDGKMEFLVDKESLKGSWVQLYNDYLGDMPMGKNFAWNCRDGYYAINWEPVVLIENLEKVLKENTTLDSDRRKKLETLKASIDEDDNNYILYAKLKK